ncbi:hypothetical protein, partial [Dokdonella sp.]|uniref:hypothetical protein n=1 Tax=Dokdonella sp. TaxID=2291710 RepID=UPI002620926D
MKHSIRLGTSALRIPRPPYVSAERGIILILPAFVNTFEHVSSFSGPLRASHNEAASRVPCAIA